MIQEIVNYSVIIFSFLFLIYLLASMRNAGKFAKIVKVIMISVTFVMVIEGMYIFFSIYLVKIYESISSLL